MDALLVSNLFTELLTELNVIDMIRYTAIHYIAPNANQVPLQMFGLSYVFFILSRSRIDNKQHVLDHGMLVIGRKKNMDFYWLECDGCYIMADGIHSIKIGLVSELDYHIIESKPAKAVYENFFKSCQKLH